MKCEYCPKNIDITQGPAAYILHQMVTHTEKHTKMKPGYETGDFAVDMGLSY